MNRAAAALPLVLTSDDDSSERIATAQACLDGVARVQALPSAGPQRAQSLREATALLAFTWRIREEEWSLLGNLRFIQSVWAGIDRLPVRALSNKFPSLQAASGTGPNALQVAEYALALYLDCAKRLSLRDRAMRAGAFPQRLPGRLVAGSEIAVVGFGRIGQRVTRHLEALGADVTPVTRNGGGVHGRASINLQACRDNLERWDGMVLAVPLTPATLGLVDAQWLAAMRSDAILVNVARGKLIDEAALLEHLRRFPEFHVGLDVWWRYRRPEVEPAEPHPLAALPNVVMSPHAAYNVPGQEREMVEAAAHNVGRFLRGETPEGVVAASDCVR